MTTLSSQSEATVHTHDLLTPFSKDIIDRCTVAAQRASGRIESTAQELDLVFQPNTSEGRTFVDLIARSDTYAEIVEEAMPENNKLPMKDRLKIEDRYTKKIWQGYFEELQPDEIQAIRESLTSPQANQWKEMATYSLNNPGERLAGIYNQRLRSLQYARAFVNYDELLNQINGELDAHKDQPIRKTMGEMLKGENGTDIFYLYESGINSASYERFHQTSHVVPDAIPRNRRMVETPTTKEALNNLDEFLKEPVDRYRKSKHEKRRAKSIDALRTADLSDDLGLVAAVAEDHVDDITNPKVYNPTDIIGLATHYVNGKDYWKDPKQPHYERNLQQKRSYDDNFEKVAVALVERLGEDSILDKPIILPNLDTNTLQVLIDDAQQIEDRNDEFLLQGLQSVKNYQERNNRKEKILTAAAEVEKTGALQFFRGLVKKK